MAFCSPGEFPSEQRRTPLSILGRSAGFHAGFGKANSLDKCRTTAQCLSGAGRNDVQTQFLLWVGKTPHLWEALNQSKVSFMGSCLRGGL